MLVISYQGAGSREQGAHEQLIPTYDLRLTTYLCCFQLLGSTNALIASG
ncbi:MAG: hypothetical protein ACRC32_13605 [Chroococcidiopsis sp.]